MKLRLYVAGDAPNSVAARAKLMVVCDGLGPGAEIEIADVFQEPLRAHHDGVLLTPMRLRMVPCPVVRVVGSLGDPGLVRNLLLDGATTP